MKITRLDAVRSTLSTALLLALASSGCGEVANPDDMDKDVDPMDETAPTVTATEPAANATAVRKDEKIHITFSEPMDAASVEAAYESSDLPADQVTFEWNPEGTVLTITPKTPLAYAEGNGTDPSQVTPKTFAIAIGANATDLAGNALGSPMSLSFSTRRRLLGLFPLDTSLTRVTFTTNSFDASEIMVGDNLNKSPYRAYLAFNLSTMPAGAEVEIAQFQGMQITPVGAPYALGVINVQHIAYTSTLQATLDATVAMSQPGMMSSNATLEAKKIIVTSQVIDDLAHRVERNNRSQYRLQIDVPTNNDDVTDRAQFSKASFLMGAIYVVD